MTALLQVLVFLAHAQVGLATNFWAYTDPGNPNPRLACIRRNLRTTDMVVAHRTLPCGARVLLYAPRTGRHTWATVAERGPFGRKTRRPSEYRAMVDLAPAATRALRANGRETVLLVPEEGWR